MTRTTKMLVILMLFLLSAPALLAAPNILRFRSYSTGVPNLTSTSQTSPIKNFTLPTSKAGPNAIVSGPNGTLWFVEFSAAKIGELFYSNSSFHEFTIPKTGAIPASLAIESQLGMIWFSDQSGSGSIWSLDPGNGTFKQYVIPTKNSYPLFVFVDSQHNIWFTETIGDKIGELTYPTYSLTEYPLPISQVEPLEMTLDKNGNTFWITVAKTTSQTQPGMLITFNILTKTFGNVYAPIVSLQDPVGIVQDNSGNLWISEHRGSAVAEFIPTNSSWKKFQTSPPPPAFGFGYVSAPATISIDGRGNLWFLEHFANRVGKLNPSTGIMEEYTIPGIGAYSVLNTVDPQGNFWFTDFAADAIGMIPGNASTSTAIQILGGSGQIPTIGAGQSTSFTLELRNLAPCTRSLSLNATSSFSADGYTTPNEVSFNVTNSAIQLGSNESEVVRATITPDITLASGIYSISVIARGENSSTIQIFFIRVNASPLYFFYHLGDYSQYILITAIVILAGIYFFVRRRTGSKNEAKVNPQASPEKGKSTLSNLTRRNQI